MFTKALRAMGSNRLLNALRFKQPAAVQAARNFGDLSFCEDDFLTEDVSLRKDFPQFDKFFDDTGILNKVGQTPLPMCILIFTSSSKVKIIVGVLKIEWRYMFS